MTDVVRARDGHYLDTFGVGQYQGVTRDHWVTLDLGPAPSSGEAWLVGIGWIHPTDSSINVALGEGHHDPPRDLSLEIPDGKGGWKTALPHLGFPEGKSKTVLIPLAGLFQPGRPRSVRLRTNMEIYWDFLGSARALPPATLRQQVIAPSEATLHYRGFSATHQAGHSSPVLPDYAHLAQTGPQWLDLAGYYTRYGDVRALIARTDDRYVIMNAGDEMVLRFAAPPPPAGGLGARLCAHRRRLGEGRRLQHGLLADGPAAALALAPRLQRAAGPAGGRPRLQGAQAGLGNVPDALGVPAAVPRGAAAVRGRIGKGSEKRRAGGPRP